MQIKTFGDGKHYKFDYITNAHAVSNITITESSIGETGVNFSYDDFGNMTGKVVVMDDGTNKTTCYSYDNNNLMKHIDLPDGMFKLDFKYSNGGQRITKTYRDNAGIINQNVYVTGFYDITNGVINKHISDGKYIFATKLEKQR